MKRPTSWTAAELFLVALLAGLPGCGSRDTRTAADKHGPTVKIVDVEPVDADIYTEYWGQTYATTIGEVRSRVEGHVEKRLFYPGQEVSAGQPLFLLDTRALHAELRQAQGELQQVEAALSLAQRQLSLREPEANLAASLIALAQAQRDYEEFASQASRHGALSTHGLDEAAVLLRSAEAKAREDQANVERIRLTTEAELQSIQGKLVAQRGVVDSIALNIEHSTIHAPISGLVGDSLAPVDGLVRPSAVQPLTSIASLDPIGVRFTLSAAQLDSLIGKKNGSEEEFPKLELELAGGTVVPYSGLVTSPLGLGDPRNGLVELRAEFPNPQHQLAPGQFKKVRYISEHRTGVILLPEGAVRHNQNSRKVFTLVKGNKIRERIVTTGAHIGEKWVIEKGLLPGDLVVVEGPLNLRAGNIVRPVWDWEETGRLIDPVQ